MIFISRNYKGKVIGIVSARTEDSVRAYYQGRGIHPHIIETFSFTEDRENEKQGYVTPILETREVDRFNLSDREKILIVI